MKSSVVASRGGFEVVRSDGAVPTYRVTKDGASLRWRTFAEALQRADELRGVLIEALASAEHAAYFFECAPWLAGLDPAVEWVLVPTRAFDVTTPDPSSFRDLLQGAVHVTTFANLRGDATLVVPTEDADRAVYGHLASFVRAAPRAQVDALFVAVGAALEAVRARSKDTLWLSTAGLGVDWLHVRIDSRPKYYRHGPYKQG
jgi:hypothetical protein